MQSSGKPAGLLWVQLSEIGTKNNRGAPRVAEAGICSASIAIKTETSCANLKKKKENFEILIIKGLWVSPHSVIIYYYVAALVLQTPALIFWAHRHWLAKTDSCGTSEKGL